MASNANNSGRRRFWPNQLTRQFAALVKKDPPPANVEEAMRRQFSASRQTGLLLGSFIMGLLAMAFVAPRLHDGSVLEWSTLAVLLAADVVALGMFLWLPRQAEQEKRLFLGPKRRR